MTQMQAALARAGLVNTDGSPFRSPADKQWRVKRMLVFGSTVTKVVTAAPRSYHEAICLKAQWQGEFSGWVVSLAEVV